MAWDDDKSTNDELTAQEWDNHVTDQKGRSKSVVQSAEPSPSNFTDGDFWNEISNQSSGFTTIYTGDDYAYDVGINESGNVAYVGDRGGATSVNVSDGTENWNNTLSGAYGIAITYSSENNKIYVADSNATLWELSNSDGSSGWTFTDDRANAFEDVEYDSINNYIYVAGDSGGENVVAVDASNGAEVWENTDPSGAVNSISYNPDDNVVYAGDSTDGNVYIIDSTNGSTITSVSNGFTSLHLDYSSNTGYFYATFNASPDNLTAYDSSDNSIVWTNTDHDPYGVVEAVGGIVYTGDSDGRVYASDSSTGTLYWSDIPSNADMYTGFSSRTDTNELYTIEAGYFELQSISNDKTATQYVLSGTDWVIQQ